MNDLPELEDWRTYPQSLVAQGCNAYGYDCLDYTEQLQRESDRLFVTRDRICLKVVEFTLQGPWEQVFGQSDEVDAYFQRPRPAGATRLILIPQQSSWGKLGISLECALKLFTTLQVFPGFIDILRAFGQKSSAIDESYGGFSFQENELSHVAECAYTVKFPEEHGRDEPRDPWSVRQMGVYQQRTKDSGGTTIVLNPSKSFLRRLKRVSSRPAPLTPWEIQVMALSASMEKWRWYISELEARVTEGKTNAQLSSMSEKTPSPLTFGDTQDIQVLQDKLSQSLHYLTTNRVIIKQIHLKREKILGVGKNAEDPFVENLIVQASMHADRVKSILKRCKGAQILAQSFLDFTCLESVKASSRSMTELQRLSQQEAEILLGLTMKASRDTDILKTLTMLTLIYLPASLVSSMMGMGYIKIVRNENRISMRIDSEMWIFVFLVVILLVVTMGSYYLWLRNKRAKRYRNC
ncbi:hypothetical protein EJ04DRAFT_549088 [Polyplosphaeria fusca]|uniref:CorA-like transporter domain-containing protein n=1 Tax=Polyplosphaeria fusca TaxID=682080 RepID=A0A9P4R584_9PLEO|nr:hypothetical protein EJ04DRAFT_549088 [Polyplosphaeria fusca]